MSLARPRLGHADAHAVTGDRLPSAIGSPRRVASGASRRCPRARGVSGQLAQAARARRSAHLALAAASMRGGSRRTRVAEADALVLKQHAQGCASREVASAAASASWRHHPSSILACPRRVRSTAASRSSLV
jgi:hypothetical protein